MATSPLDLKDCKDRIKALYKEAFAALAEPETNVDVENDVGYVSEAFPYVTLRTGDVVVEGDGEELDVYTIQVVAEVYADWASADQPTAEVEDRIDGWIMFFIHYFNERELLQSAAFPTATDDLDYARVTGSSGYRQTRTGGAAGETKKLATFTHTLHAENVIEQVYL